MAILSLRTVAITILGLVLTAAADDAAPNLELHDLKGISHRLQDYRGKPVVLNFWATWCVPCATEMPLLSEMQKRYAGKVVFIAASVDFDEQKPSVEAFITKHHGQALTVMMGAELDNLRDFGLAQVMPGTVFIDAEGKIVERASGGLKRPYLEGQMRKLAGEPEALPTNHVKPAGKTSNKASKDLGAAARPVTP
ncbi:MAG TPA: TlpA disulfide reductase family protein [Candidatus Angelobacter sp.]|nr:TlpA disulfide reductase family protein [Candidatus Angelobacter sp.]